MVQATEFRDTGRHAFVKGIHGVRYQVKDVARSVAFYTQHLGFKLERQALPAFAHRARGRCRAGSSRSRAAGIAWC
jgi:glyoxylase I family protein